MESAAGACVVARREQSRFIEAGGCHIDLVGEINMLECELSATARAEGSRALFGRIEADGGALDDTETTRLQAEPRDDGAPVVRRQIEQ
jgi:hypothetical protein